MTSYDYGWSKTTTEFFHGVSSFKSDDIDYDEIAGFDINLD